MTEQTVNAYHISADIICSPDWDEYPYLVEYTDAFDSLVFAHSRGQARAFFCEEHQLEFTEKMSIQIIRKNVSRSLGIAKDDDLMWIEVTTKFAKGSLPTEMLIPDTVMTEDIHYG